MATNYKPAIRGTDHGIWRRIRLIPFTRQFVGEAADPNLLDTLRGEGEKAMSGNAFGRRMVERGADKVKDRTGWRYVGLGLTAETVTDLGP